MRYTLLELQNFRSYQEATIELSPSVNIVVGPNASGKTNLLEALLVAGHGQSYRTGDAELIRHGADWARIDAHGDQHRTVKLQRREHVVQRQLSIDDKPLRRLTSATMAPITLFEPEHLRLVHGPPELRRDYLDGLLEQLVPGYRDHMQRYRRALSQRNRLLKNRPAKLQDQIFVWDLKLSEHGAVMVQERRRLVEQINEQASDLYARLSGQVSQLEVVYHSPLATHDTASSLLKQLQHKLETDIERGFTGVGPHRDDLSFSLNGHPAGDTASRGETRTIVLMCKLMELTLLETQRDEPPVLLLDDVFSELDGSRRHALTDYLRTYQTIITTTDADAILQHFVGDYNIIPTKTN